MGLTLTCLSRLASSLGASSSEGSTALDKCCSLKQAVKSASTSRDRGQRKAKRLSGRCWLLAAALSPPRCYARHWSATIYRHKYRVSYVYASGQCMEQRSCGCSQLWHSAPPGMAVGCELRLRSTPRYRLVCICFPTPGRGLPYGSGLGLSRCLGPGECLHS